MDVKTTFLYGKIKKEVYVKLPLSISNLKGLVVMFNKAFYGFKQTLKIWYN